ncbi:MAG: hypothetical protein ACI9G1_003787 [Pirellulaceae bacterium]
MGKVWLEVVLLTVSLAKRWFETRRLILEIAAKDNVIVDASNSVALNAFAKGDKSGLCRPIAVTIPPIPISARHEVSADQKATDGGKALITNIDLGLVLSALSCLFTAYFWIVKVRKEQPNIQFFQLSNFRSSLRRHPDREDVKRFSLQQLDTGGVLIVNHSTRQNSIVLFECFLKTDGGEIQGDWGYSGEDKPPWNVGPETSIAFSPVCFFDVPSDFETPENPEFRLEFITASGKTFSHRFTQEAPQFRPTQKDKFESQTEVQSAATQEPKASESVATESDDKSKIPPKLEPTIRPVIQPTRRAA